MKKNYQLPCKKNKFKSKEEAISDMLSHITDLERMNVYMCLECSIHEPVWHYGHVRKNGKARIKLPSGGHYSDAPIREF